MLHLDAPLPFKTRWHDDPAFRGGPRPQAAYLARSVPTLLAAGAQRVFVTERDNLHGRFTSCSGAPSRTRRPRTRAPTPSPPRP